MNQKLLIYDCEIIRCIPGSDGERSPQYKYCEGWNDHANMGISVIGTYSENLLAPGAVGFNAFINSHSTIPMEPLLVEAFQRWVDMADIVIGFNSIAFDDLLCRANGITIATTYDLLCEVRLASGQPPQYVQGQTRAGYNLEALAQANLGYGKSGSGALAPELWQKGQHQAVIDYCLDDIRITKALWDKRHRLTDPTTGEELGLKI